MQLALRRLLLWVERPGVEVLLLLIWVCFAMHFAVSETALLRYTCLPTIPPPKKAAHAVPFGGGILHQFARERQRRGVDA